MEHFTCSTPALLFSFIHWTHHLDSPASRQSAELTFDQFIDKCLESKMMTMLLEEDVPCGSLPASGVAIQYRSGCIPDEMALCDNFKVIKKALGRTLESFTDSNK